MAGNHDQPRKVRKFLRKIMGAMRRGGMRVRAVSSSGEREANLDFFPGNVFDHARWTSKNCATPDEVRNTLQSFNLVGREIWSVYTSSTDYRHSAERILEDTGTYVSGKEMNSKSNIGAYVYLCKKARLKREMEIDEPFVVEFKDGDTFEIDVGMDPELCLSFNRIPNKVARNDWEGVDPSIMFSDVIGKKIVAVDVATEVRDTHPCCGGKLDPPQEMVSSVSLRFGNGSSLRFAPYYDYLEVDSRNRNGEVKTVSWESVRGGVTTWEDRSFDKKTGYVAREGRLMFGAKGGRAAGEHSMVLSPGPGWHPVIPSGREAYLPFQYVDVLGMSLIQSVGKAAEAEDHVDLTLDEWSDVLSTMERILESRLFRHVGSSAFLHALCRKELSDNEQRPKSDFRRVDDVVSRFVKTQRELLEDLKGWTKRAFKPGGMLRIKGL